MARVHSDFIDRMNRSMTAMLPYLPIAPKRWRTWRRRHHAANSSAVNWVPWSVIRCAGRQRTERPVSALYGFIRGAGARPLRSAAPGARAGSCARSCSSAASRRRCPAGGALGALVQLHRLAQAVVRQSAGDATREERPGLALEHDQRAVVRPLVLVVEACRVVRGPRVRPRRRARSNWSVSARTAPPARPGCRRRRRRMSRQMLSACAGSFSRR